IRIRNSRINEAALRWTDENIAIRLAADLQRLDWRSDPAAASSLAGTGIFDGDLSVRENQLVLDANAPVQLRMSLGAQPARTFDANLPLLAAFSADLKPGPGGSAS